MENNLNIVKSEFKELPNNIEAEQSVIGSILVTNEIFDEISTIISSINFYDPMHQKIYNAIESLIYKGMLANPITLKNYFEDEKDDLDVPEYLVKITKFSTSIRQAIEYSKIIYDMFVRRELIKISEQTIDNAKITDLDSSGQNIIENSERLLFDLAEKGSFNSSLIKFDDAMKQTIEMASAAYKNEGGIVGVPTGLRDLDDKLGGLHQSDLIIIAGRPSMGKTSLATNIAFNAAKHIQDNQKKSSVAFFSLEMSSEQLSTRILSEQARIGSNDIRRGRISDEQFDQFLETSKNIAELPLFIDETPAISIAAMSNRARRIKRLHGLDMIVVDYIQLMRGTTYNKDGRVQEISQITQGLKAIAKELGVPVVALSQLSRQVEQRDDHKPQLADLRESGSIEQDADVVMFVYREGYYLQRKEPREATVEHAEWQAKMNEVAHLAEIIIGKQRHGPIGKVTLEFEKDLQNLKILKLIKFKYKTLMLTSLYENTILKNPKFIILILFITLISFGYYSKDFRLDASSETLLIEDDPDLEYLREITNRYGSKEFLVLTYTPNEGMISNTSINNLLSLKYKIQSLDWVHSVITLLDIPLLNNTDAPLQERLKGFKTLKDEDVDKNRGFKEILESPVFRNFVISESGKTSGIIVNIKQNPILEDIENRSKKEIDEHRDKIKKQNHKNILEIRDVIKSYDDVGKIYLGGIPMIADDMMTFIKSDIIVFGLGVLLFIIATLWFVFKK